MRAVAQCAGVGHICLKWTFTDVPVKWQIYKAGPNAGDAYSPVSGVSQANPTPNGSYTTFDCEYAGACGGHGDHVAIAAVYANGTSGLVATVIP